MKSIPNFFSILWLSLSLSKLFTYSPLLLFHARFKDLTCKSSEMCECDIKKVMANRKPWYQRAMAVARYATSWRTIPKLSSQQQQQQQQQTEMNIRTSRNPSVNNKSSSNQNQIHHQLRKCSSLKVAANSFTRVCLCAPIGPYDDVFRNYVPPRRSCSYPPSKPLPMVTETAITTAVATAARMSTDSSGRRMYFRGKSLKENALMRRFVAAEEEAMMENRRRDQMEIVRKRNQMRRKKKLGPSPLSRMVIAEDEQAFHH
ncbi:PREDICTED: uncharacterized protein LOC104749375 [Camelina sativa]|uniref:Uncharacterized protein LOC104749375 n=1 Tax=Camelina sativa TaxID=90675 RepID=A0ABM0WCY7_CAMSA|nr:PREDICTED: uncharacterized protein LOC104749375 [Camelina sativa]